MWECAVATDTGLRQSNEDNALCARLTLDTPRKDPTSERIDCSGAGALMVMVADGVGGLSMGERASKMTIDTASGDVLASIADLLLGREPVRDGDIFNTLIDAAGKANEKVMMSLQGESGSTLTTALILENAATYIVSIGDSRAYIISEEDEIVQVTEDQSLAWQDFAKSEMPNLEKALQSALQEPDGAPPSERVRQWRTRLMLQKKAYIANHPQSHVIWNVVGHYAKMENPSMQKLYMDDRSILLLCTDGLTDELSDVEILDVVRNSRWSSHDAALETVAKTLIERAKRAGGHDNITLALVAKAQADGRHVCQQGEDDRSSSTT